MDAAAGKPGTAMTAASRGAWLSDCPACGVAPDSSGALSFIAGSLGRCGNFHIEKVRRYISTGGP